MARRPEAWLVAGLLTLCVAPALSSSLWLDEAGTRWIVSDGAALMWQRATVWSASSPFYYSVAWAWSRLFGVSEVALRLPSVLCSIANCVVIYRLASRWLEPRDAIGAVVFFWCIPAVQFTVCDARPYALGLLALSSAWLSALRLLEAPDGPRTGVFVLCAAAVVWSHYTLGLGLIPLILYGPRLGWRRTIAVAGGVCILVFPLAVQLIETMQRRQALSWARPPGWGDGLAAAGLLFLPMVAFGLITASGHFRRAERDESYSPVLWLAVTPVIIVFAISRWAGVQLFVPRYLVAKELGAAIAAALFVAALPKESLRRMAIVIQVLLAVSLTVGSAVPHGGEDWRAAAGWVREELAANPATTVVAVSGFVESEQPRYLDDPAYREILLAPFFAYPVPAPIIPLPWQLTPDADARLSTQVAGAARASGRVVLVALSLRNDYRARIVGRLQSAGLQQVSFRQFSGVEALVFVRDADPATAK